MSERVKDYNNLPDWVQPGVCYLLDFGEGNPNTRRYHVRGIVDGNAVLATWWKYKQRWNYTVEGPIWFYVAGQNMRDIKPSTGTMRLSDKTKTERECAAGRVAGGIDGAANTA